MTPSDIRTQTKTRFNPIASLLRRAGVVGGRRRLDVFVPEVFERLEDRALLAGDEPGFAQIFNTPTPGTPAALTAGPGGTFTSQTGSGMSTIGTPGDDDVFTFTAPANDFVRVWADTRSSNSLLDSRVEVYTGTPGGAATPVAAGSSQGTLTTGTFKDGWVGFIATAGTQYFVVVRSDLMSGGGSQGDYVLRVNAATTAFPTLNTTTGAGSASGSITLAGGDVVYKLTTGTQDAFHSLMTIIAQADATDLDTRLDIYDDTGSLLIADSDTGNLSNAYLALLSQPNTTFYLRVRSDEFGNPATRPSTGNFTLVVDGIAESIPMDPVTRLGRKVGASLGGERDALSYQFVAQGTGISFIDMDPVSYGPFGLPDSGLHIYDDHGVQIGFNELPGQASQLLINLVGGRTYYLVAENFDFVGGGLFDLNLEVHHTWGPQFPTNDTSVDDHANTPTIPSAPIPQATFDAFDLATPIIFGPPQTADISSMVPPTMPTPLPSLGTDHSMIIRGEATGRIFDNTDTDLFQFVAPVDMLGQFGGKDDMAMAPTPRQWQAHYRPADSLQILMGGDIFIDTQVRVFDSNLQVIYATNNNVFTPGFPDPSGVLDPASFPPEMPIMAYGYTWANTPIHIPVWGGEVYYIEVSANAGQGRYNMEVQVDAPVDDPAVSTFYPTVPSAGAFDTAPEISIDAGSGEGRNFSDVTGGQVIGTDPFGLIPGPAGNGNFSMGRAYAANLLLPTPPPAGMGAAVDPTASIPVGTPGSRGRLIMQIGDLDEIQSPTDTKLYKFRALYTGTTEVRLATTQITDGYLEAQAQTEDGDPMTPPVITTSPLTKTYNSPLDGALRIFDNDQTEIGYNNDNNITPGETLTTSVGANTRTFTRRDPAITFNVVAGRTYYVQVESGQRSNFTLAFPKVDWRHATGSFELLINSMPFLLFADDHSDGQAPNPQATPFPIDQSITSPTATLGTVDGQILDHAVNSPDVDMFSLDATADRTARITVSVAQGDSFLHRVQIFDAQGGLLGEATADNTDDAVVNLDVTQGQRIYIRVDGGQYNGPGTTGQGHYVVKVSGIPVTDDVASVSDFNHAREIPKDTYDYDGTETVMGSIESAGDTDIFTFQTIAFDTATITIQGNTPNFHPAVTIYEIGEDGAAHPVLLRIAHNDNSGGSDVAATSFSVTAPQRTSTTSHETYNNYFVVVSGADRNLDKGDYSLTLTLNVKTDDHPDAGQYDVATVIPLDPATGIGHSPTALDPDQVNNHIEVVGDTDLFQFDTLSQGQVTLTLTSPHGSLLLPRIRVFDSSHNPVADIHGAFFVTGPDMDVSEAVFQFVGLRNTTYFIQVEGVAFGTVKTAQTGAYTLDIGAPVPDDHPNETEFNQLGPNDTIPLSIFTGDGTGGGQLETGSDTDLFTFTTLPNVGGLMRITINTPSSNFRPVLRLFDPATAEIGTAVVDGGAGDEDGQVNGSVTRSISTAQGAQYYLLVSSDQGEPTTTGVYTVILDGNTPPPGNDDYANAGDWPNAALIQLSQLTGDATRTGNIEITSDTDLLKFQSIVGSPTDLRKAFVQIVTPNGSPLNVGVKIYKQIGNTFVQVVEDTEGGPGTNAQVQFDIDEAGATYFVEVDGLGGTGGYTINIDTQPDTFYLYYPEGFANSAIREYVSMGNDNDVAVPYTIRLKYESGDPDTVLTGMLDPHARGGVTISDGTNNPGSGVLFNKPYAIVIESPLFIGANISHYDFGNTLGEAFTGRTSDTWSFALGQRFHGQVADFLLYYNPNPGDVIVTLTAYQTDPNTQNVTTVAISQMVHGGRRFGWNFDQTAQLPLGAFSFVITAAPVNPTDSFVGIVAALSHNDLANSDGYAVLGDPDSGSGAGVAPGVTTGTNITPMVTFFNSSDTATTVGIIGKYIDNAFPAITRSVALAPHQSITMSAADLGLVANETVGLRYDASNGARVTMLAATRQNGDADATSGSTRAATDQFFGDAFINRRYAGTLYFENLYFYNPTVQDMQVTLTFVFNDGFVSNATVSIAAKDFASVALHSLGAVVNHRVFNYFSVIASSDTPFIATMTHYDLVLNGGWGSQGAPLGPTNPISTI